MQLVIIIQLTVFLNLLTRAAADLPVKTLNHVVGADVRPVPRREFKVEVSVSSIPASIFLAALVSQGGRSVPLSPGQ